MCHGHHAEQHDGDPHDVGDVARHLAQHEGAVADLGVVLVVAADERGAEVQHQAARVNHQHAEQHAAEGAARLAADVVLAERVRLRADHGHHVEGGGGDDDDVGGALEAAVGGRGVAQQVDAEGDAVGGLQQVEEAGVDEEGRSHLAQRAPQQDGDDHHHVERDAHGADEEEVVGLLALRLRSHRSASVSRLARSLHAQGCG